MAIDYEKLLALDIPEVEQVYTAKDTMLYALGVGVGQNPTRPEELAFVYEKGLKALPSMACVLAHPPFWLRDLNTGIDFTKVVHGEQSFRLHRPLAPSGHVRGKTRIVDIIDKGAGRGVVLHASRILLDAASGEEVATVEHTVFCRGEGGFGGPARASPPPPPPAPNRDPDGVCDLPTRPETALIYRLSGDYNPLHVDPEAARAAGFPQPILHGLATFGVACHALVETLCGYAPEGLRAMGGRFSAPVFPGETIRTEIWRDGARAWFRSRVLEREAVVISHGRAELA